VSVCSVEMLYVIAGSEAEPSKVREAMICSTSP
jgi:hypothetical protein